MAATSLIQQTIIFVSPTNQFNESAIWSNSLVQSLAANSIGGDVIYGYQQYANWDSTNKVWTYSSFFMLTCFIQPSFQSTVQANIPTLRNQLPQYNIYTWGNATAFGN